MQDIIEDGTYDKNVVDNDNDNDNMYLDPHADYRNNTVGLLVWWNYVELFRIQ